MLASFEAYRFRHDVRRVAPGGATVRDSGKDVTPGAEAVNLDGEISWDWGMEGHGLGMK